MTSNTKCHENDSIPNTESANKEVADYLDFKIMLVVILATVVIGGVIYAYVNSRRSSSEEPPSLVPIPEPRNCTGTQVAQKESETFVSKMKATNRSMVVFYGSQTGTAEGFAYRLAKDAQRYGIGAQVMDPDECSFDALADMQTIENPLVVFCVATYGEGNATDNAQRMFEWLSQAPESGVDLTGINFAVFGLGNKNFEHYNSVGKEVDKQLETLHAQRICELGLGNDDANIEDDFVLWCETFWAGVCFKFGISPRANTEDGTGSRQYRLINVANDQAVDKLFTGEPASLRSFSAQKPPFGAKNPYLTVIREKRELHKGGERSCLHIEMDISGSYMCYKAGDHVAILPENDPDLVAKFGKRLDADLGRTFLLENVDPDATKRNPFPCPTTYGTALTHYVDIASPPRKNVLRELAEWTEDVGEKTFLRLLSSPSVAGRAKYDEWVLGCRRDLLAILEDLPNLKPPVDLICELLPRLQPRYYSIASSPKLHPHSIHITAVVVEYTTKAGRLARGVCTNFLRDKPVGEKVPIFIRPSRFRLPVRPSAPVMMVGPGTGLAPFRGFLQDRWLARKEGKSVGDTVLFFGCRKQAEDYIYEEELKNWWRDGTITELHVAFSRDQATKCYVQHLIKKNAVDIWRLVHTNHAHVYVCGDASKMARDVYATLVDICAEQGNMQRSAAVEYMKRLSTQGRYSADVWS